MLKLDFDRVQCCDTTPVHMIVTVPRSLAEFIEDRAKKTGSPAAQLAGELLEDDFSYTGVALAHELGHYFGLGHKNQWPENLMCQGSEDGQLDDKQIEKIKNHDKVFDACKSA